MKITYSILLLFLFLAQMSWGFPIIPNPEMTPGGVCTKDSPDFSTYRYQQQIPYCARSVSTGLKNKIYEKYGIPSKCRKQYTIDHLIPLSIGGNNDIKNLWPEHKILKRSRQNLEVELFKKLEANQILQKDAIARVINEKLNPTVKPDPNSQDECQRFVEFQFQ
ncbi:MAG: HNH endonuclease signature motif containing protein [Bacteriovoracaceae bacterium]|nr:HNH endonuclease signature motif containing protein [Bacteriovoracaceae bacterium]